MDIKAMENRQLNTLMEEAQAFKATIRPTSENTNDTGLRCS